MSDGLLCIEIYEDDTYAPEVWFDVDVYRNSGGRIVGKQVRTLREALDLVEAAVAAAVPVEETKP